MDSGKNKLILVRQNIKLEDSQKELPSIAIIMDGKIKETADIISAITGMSYEEIISRSLLDGMSNILETLADNK